MDGAKSIKKPNFYECIVEKCFTWTNGHESLEDKPRVEVDSIKSSYAPRTTSKTSFYSHISTFYILRQIPGTFNSWYPADL